MSAHGTNGATSKVPHWTTLSQFAKDLDEAIALHPERWVITPEERVAWSERAERDIARDTKILRARGYVVEGEPYIQ